MRDDLTPERKRSTPSFSIRNYVLAGLFAVLLLYLLGTWLYHAFIESPEDKIRSTILSAAQGARDRNPSLVSEILSEDFKGPLGATKEDAHAGLIQILMVQNQRIDVALAPEPLPVTIDPNDAKKAVSAFKVRVRGKATPDSNWYEIKTPRSEGAQFHCGFKLTEKGWKMYELSITE